MEEFSYMYHGTNSKAEIKESGYLRNNTWFCCSLLYGHIPYNQPFGIDRVCISVEDILKLFNDPRLYYQRTGTQNRDDYVNLYHALYLSDGPVSGKGKELDIATNKYLQLVGENGMEFMVKEVGSESERHWVHVEVGKRIELKKVHHYWE